MKADEAAEMMDGEAAGNKFKKRFETLGTAGKGPLQERCGAMRRLRQWLRWQRSFPGAPCRPA